MFHTLQTILQQQKGFKKVNISVILRKTKPIAHQASFLFYLITVGDQQVFSILYPLTG
jgi:hypothetical protein